MSELVAQVKKLGPLDGRHVLVIDSEGWEPAQLRHGLDEVRSHFRALGITAPMVVLGRLDSIHALDELEMATYGWKRIEGAEPA